MGECSWKGEGETTGRREIWLKGRLVIFYICVERGGEGFCGVSFDAQVFL